MQFNNLSDPKFGHSHTPFFGGACMQLILKYRVNACFCYDIMECVKTENQKVRQNGVFLHTSRLALENLSETRGISLISCAVASKEWGRNELGSKCFELKS